MLLYMHTAKAVKVANAPEDRVFFVVPWNLLPKNEQTHRKGELFAWKASLRKTGVWHPLAGLVPFELLEEARELWTLGLKGSRVTPTALFVPDSFYVKTTLAQLKTKAKTLPVPVDTRPAWLKKCVAQKAANARKIRSYVV